MTNELTELGLNLRVVDVDTLTPHPRNYNQHSESQVGELGQSLGDFGQYKNVVCWTDPDNGRLYILAGHGLLEAAKADERARIAVNDRSDLTRAQAMALMFSDNFTTSTDFDYTMLSDLVTDEEFPKDVPGLSDEALAEILEMAEVEDDGGGSVEDVAPQIDKAAELQEVWQTALGQIWELGEHRLACGDCTDVTTVEQVLDGDVVNFAFADPPYSVGYADKNRSLNASAKGNCIQTPILGDHLSTKETAEQIWLPAFKNMYAVAVPGCVYYVTAPQGGDQMMMMMMMLEQAGWLVKHELIWVKNNHVLGRADYQYKHEPIIYGWKPGAAHYFIDSRSEMSVWEIDKPHRSDMHPTTKPLELVERAMRNSSKRGDIVIDFFLGSGTTLLAAEGLSRVGRFIELAPGYCAVTLQRYLDATGKTPKLMGSI